MRIRFLGTAAAEAIPSLWCECELCRRARKTGGKEIRHRCGYLIDDDTLVDPGPDLFTQSLLYGIEWEKLRRILVTHAHGDHFAVAEIGYRRSNYARVGRTVELVAGDVSLQILAEGTGVQLSELFLDPVVIAPGKCVVSGDVSVRAAAARHAEKLGAMVYLVERGGKRFFICNDSGLLDAHALENIAHLELDAVSVDCTGAFAYQQKVNHNGTENALRQFDVLREIGCVTGKTRRIVNHFSHNGKASHAQLVEFFTPFGVEVAFDGMEITL